VNGDDDIAAVETWLQAFDQDFFVKGYNAPVSHLNKRFSGGGDHVKK
jgi:hypothetical protein